MIKTKIAGDALAHALKRHQQWVDEYDALKRARVEETERLTIENAELRRRLKLAKATPRSTLRSERSE